MKLNLGVVELPYVDTKGVSTTQVARWLEDKYHIMEVFYEVHADDIANAIADSLTSAMINQGTNIVPDSGANASGPALYTDPFGDAMAEIEDMFKQFLSLREIETMGIPGVPTEAALRGVSHRFKRKRGARRPSFIDTGLYESAFKPWIE